MSWLHCATKQTEAYSFGNMKIRDALRIMAQWGFQITRTTGSHMFLSNGSCHPGYIPMHTAHDESRTIQSVMSRAARCVGVSLAEFVEGPKREPVFSCGIGWLKQAQGFVQEQLSEGVDIPKNWKQFLICSIKGTIQHEAQHRHQKETGRDWDPESQLERDAEGVQGSCGELPAAEGWTKVSKAELFRSALGSASIPPNYKQDVKAVTLPSELGAVGLFELQKNPEKQQQVMLRPSASGQQHTYQSDDPMNRMMYVDVSGIIAQFLPQGYKIPQDQSNVPRDQQRFVGQVMPGQSTGTAHPTMSGIGAVPSVPSVEGRESI